jgi:hypothetical protein
MGVPWRDETDDSIGGQARVSKMRQKGPSPCLSNFNSASYFSLRVKTERNVDGSDSKAPDAHQD